MTELSQMEIDDVSGAGWEIVVAVYDAVTDGAKGFWEGAKAGWNAAS